MISVTTRNSFLVFNLLLLFAQNVMGQEILDPCFTSVKELGYYYGGDSLRNICGCNDNFIASDLMEWDGDEWIGRLDHCDGIDLSPGFCGTRAIWLGSNNVTGGGEGFGLRFKEPLQSGKTYTFTFTYASDGCSSNGHFAPSVFTDTKTYTFTTAYLVGKMPEAGNEWFRGSITFTATEKQAGHVWIIFKAFDSSGTFLSDCAAKKIYSNFLPSDTTLCSGEKLQLNAMQNPKYQYEWNDGSIKPFTLARDSGTYSVSIKYNNCTYSDSIKISYEDCSIILNMPNVFTPNGDETNQFFKPIDYNYISSGTIKILNRWGELVSAVDLFTGWDGRQGNSDVGTGVYYYEVNFVDQAGGLHKRHGNLLLLR